MVTLLSTIQCINECSSILAKSKSKSLERELDLEGIEERCCGPMGVGWLCNCRNIFTECVE